MISQKIKSIIYPIIGLDLEPPTPTGELRIEGDVQPTLALLVGKGANGSVWVEATGDGSLKVADTGSGLEAYEVFSATATDINVELGLATTSSSITLQVKSFGLTFSFQKSDLTWGGDIELSVGWHSFDFTMANVRVKNTTSGGAADSVYQIIVFS